MSYTYLEKNQGDKNAVPKSDSISFRITSCLTPHSLFMPSWCCTECNWLVLFQNQTRIYCHHWSAELFIIII